MSRRDECHQHYLDTSYAVWRSGGNSDRVDPDVCTDRFYAGKTPQQTADWYMQQERNRRMAAQAEEDRFAAYEQEQMESEQDEQEQPESEAI